MDIKHCNRVNNRSLHEETSLDKVRCWSHNRYWNAILGGPFAFLMIIVRSLFSYLVASPLTWHGDMVFCSLCNKSCFVKWKLHIFSGLFIGEVRTWDSNASSTTSTRDGVGVYLTIDWYFILLISSKIIYALYGDKNDTPQKQKPVICPGALRENAVDVR
jgi:hypothetical protein